MASTLDADEHSKDHSCHLAAVVAFLALASVFAWVPIAAPAGILIVIGVRMIDWRSVKALVECVPLSR